MASLSTLSIISDEIIYSKVGISPKIIEGQHIYYCSLICCLCLLCLIPHICFTQLTRHALLACRDLNRVVLDYLIIEGYCDAATEFAKEAGIDINVDYQSIEERMLIRQAVEAGRVDEAVRRVNELEPEVSIFFSRFALRNILPHLARSVNPDD